MATVEQLPAQEQVEQFAPSESIVLKNIPWALYEALRDVEENWHLKMTYDDGVLELMSPSAKHETLKTRIGRLIEVLTEELRIPIECFGSTTWKRPMGCRGLEADTCYYIRNEPSVRGKEDVDQDVDPPPDLAIEIEVSREAVAKEPIYAGLRVAEIWRCGDKSLRCFHLAAGGEYIEHEMSLNLPFLRVADLLPFLARRRGIDSNAWIGGFRAWVREQFRPGKAGPLQG